MNFPSSQVSLFEQSPGLVLSCCQAIKWHRAVKQGSTAASLQAVLDTAGSDSALGLRFERRFEEGEIGFPGFFLASDGMSVPVRVLSGSARQTVDPAHGCTRCSDGRAATCADSCSRSTTS